MHGPWRANPEGLLQVAGQQSALPLGTPPHNIGGQSLRKGSSRPSANETVAMRDNAFESEKI